MSIGTTHSDTTDASLQLRDEDNLILNSAFDDTASSRNAIEVLLDSYLDAHQDIDAVVASWDVLHTAWASPQQITTSSKFSFAPIQTNDHGEPSTCILARKDSLVRYEESVGILNIVDNSSTDVAQPDDHEMVSFIFQTSLLRS